MPCDHGSSAARMLAAVLLMVLGWSGSAVPAAAQACISEVRLLDDFTSDPWATPTTRRSHGVEAIMWNGTRYLLVNDGNGLRIWSLADPQNPVYKSRRTLSCNSGCWTGLDGDNDWQLLQLSVCDDCRYGFVDFGCMGRAVLDLGTGTVPAIQTAHGYWASQSPYVGGMVFKHGSSELLITQGITPACANGSATLMLINGSSSLTTLQCLEKNGGQAVSIAGGLYVAGQDAGYVYLGDSLSLIHIYRVTGTGASTRMTWLGSNMQGTFGYGAGPSIDRAWDLLVTVQGTGAVAPNVRLYDITDPSLPDLLSSMQVTGDYYNRGEVQYPFLWIASQAHLSSKTYDISVLTSPDPVDPTFWNPSQPWNSRVKTQDYDGELSLDGTQLYLARFSITQQISLATCNGTMPPIADLMLSPSPAFPGDEILVTNTSSGLIDEAALWITDGGGSLVAGSMALTAGTMTLRFTIPADVPFAATYTAHVAVQNDDNPIDWGFPGGQLEDVPLQIDREPGAQLALTANPETSG